MPAKKPCLLVRSFISFFVRLFVRLFVCLFVFVERMGALTCSEVSGNGRNRCSGKNKRKDKMRRKRAATLAERGPASFSFFLSARFCFFLLFVLKPLRDKIEVTFELPVYVVSV